MTTSGEKIEVFRRLASAYSRAVRRADAVAARGSHDEIDEAIGRKQEFEKEFDDCFVMVRTPAAEFLGG